MRRHTIFLSKNQAILSKLGKTAGRCSVKKNDIIQLIECYCDNNEEAFRRQAYKIAETFIREGDREIGEYLFGILTPSLRMTTASFDSETPFFRRVDCQNLPSLTMPEAILGDLTSIVNALTARRGVNKFLFKGKPGTGKTESARLLAKALGRELLCADTSSLIDSKLGQSAKNIQEVFRYMRSAPQDSAVFFFDEFDAIAMDRTNDRDLREMGRVTSAFLKGMDELPAHVTMVAATNLFDSFDKALVRRFDYIVDFDRYTRDELAEVAEAILDETLRNMGAEGRNIRLFRKILDACPSIPYPGDLKNIIRTSVAFSDPGRGLDYLRRIFPALVPGAEDLKVKDLAEMGFTLREIETLTLVPKSTAALELKGIS